MLMLKYKRLSALFIVLSLAYLAQSALLPPDKAALQKYHITSGQAIGLTLTIAIPYLVIWFVALVGYLRLSHYARSIKDDKDGAAFLIIARGVLLLTLWLPLSALLSSGIPHYYQMHPSSTANLVRLNNYANMAILFPAFLIINRGAQRLSVLVKRPHYQVPQTAMIVYISLAALYVFLTLNDGARRIPTKSVAVATYYLPDWATIVTIVIPRLIMWYLGIQAVYYIYGYAKKVKGSLYKYALNGLARGLSGVVIATIILRCYQSLSSQLSHLSLGLLLLVIYGLLIVISVGYVLIAKGAKSLQKIEEI